MTAAQDEVDRTTARARSLAALGDACVTLAWVLGGTGAAIGLSMIFAAVTSTPVHARQACAGALLVGASVVAGLLLAVVGRTARVVASLALR